MAFLLCVVWAGDTAALYVGRAWGRHKMAPTLSPNKTWEGALGSLAGSLLVAGALLGLAELLEQWDSAVLSYPDDLWYWLVLAVVVNVAAQVGDLAESALKRSAGVKDSGTLLPGHGGVLDRIDACCWPLRCCGTLRLFTSGSDQLFLSLALARCGEGEPACRMG